MISKIATHLPPAVLTNHDLAALFPGWTAEMGKAGRRLAEEHYDVNKVNQQMLEFMGLTAKTSSN